MVDIAGSYDPNAEAQTEFEPVPAGRYLAQIENAEIANISRMNDYGECLALTWRIIEGEYENRLIWQRLSLWGRNMNKNDMIIQIANSQMAAIRKATGIMVPQDTDELLHIPCLISVGIREDKTGRYEPQNEIKKVMPLLTGTNNAPRNPARQPAAAGGVPTWKMEASSRLSSPSPSPASVSRPWGNRTDNNKPPF